MALDDTRPLIDDPHAPQEPAPGLNRAVVYSVLGVLSVGGLIALFLGVQRFLAPPPPPRHTVTQDAPPMTTPPAALDPFVKDMRFSFANYDRRPKESPPPATPAIPPTGPLFAFQPDKCPAPRLGTPPDCVCPPGTVEPACTVPPKTEAKTETKAEAKPAAKTQAKEAEKPKRPDDWLFATIKGSSRMGNRTGSSGEGGADGGQEGSGSPRRGGHSALFPPAKWEQPADPDKVIYSSQIMNCVLEQAIRTGHDGTVRCRVTETLYDKFGHLKTLVPLYSLIMGKVSGANVRAGQTTVPIAVTKVELPDGTDLPLTGNMGGADGISGVPGKVDNRIPQVILTAVLTAATSIGARSITGSPDNYQPTIGQEMSADVAQSSSRSGQDIMKRTLSIDPIITIAAQSPVTIQLDSNVSLQTPARIVHR